jgi:acetyl-CoA acyltransferase
MGLTAEKVAQQWGVSREDQDAFAVESHRRAIAAIDSGAFKSEITPLEVTYRTPNLETGEVISKTKLLDTDEGPRRETTLEGLAKLKRYLMPRAR